MGFGSVNQQVFIQCFLWTQNTVNSAGCHRQRQSVRGRQMLEKQTVEFRIKHHVDFVFCSSLYSHHLVALCLALCDSHLHTAWWSSASSHLPLPSNFVSRPQLFFFLFSSSHFLGKTHWWLSSCEILSAHSAVFLPWVTSFLEFLPPPFSKDNDFSENSPPCPSAPASQVSVFLLFCRLVLP